MWNYFYKEVGEYVYLPSTVCKTMNIGKEKVFVKIRTVLNREGHLLNLKNRKLIEEMIGGDKDYMLQGVKLDGRILELGDYKIRNDFEVVYEAVSNYGRSLWFGSKEMRENKIIVERAIKNDVYGFIHAGVNIKKDIEFILNNNNREKLLSFISRYNPGYPLEEEKYKYRLIESGCSLSKLVELLPDSSNILNDFNILRMYIRKEGYDSYKLIGDEIKNNKEEMRILKKECRMYHLNGNKKEKEILYEVNETVRRGTEPGEFRRELINS